MVTSAMAATLQECSYEEVELERVPLDVWLAAKRALRYCEPDLGLPMISIKWIRQAELAVARMGQFMESLAEAAGDWKFKSGTFTDTPLTGQARGGRRDEILVRCDLPADEVIRVVAHECQHLADYRDFGTHKRTPAEDVVLEKRAMAYEAKVASVLLGQSR